MRDINASFKVHPRATAPEKRIKGEHLDDVYGCYSAAKARAYMYCKDLEAEFDGFDGGITSYNVFSFTYMFDFANPDTGELMRAHITPTCNHAYYL